MRGIGVSGGERLRVGLLLDSFVQPRWRYKVIEDICSSPVAEVVLVVMNDSATSRKASLARKVWEKRGSLLYDLYTKLDNYVFTVEPDAFESVSAEGLLAGCPVVAVRPVMKKFSDYFPEKDLESIRGYDLDVALRFGFRILKGEVLGIARHGVWSYHHGDNLINRGTPPGFWEVMEDEPVTGSMLQVLSDELDNGRVIYRSWAPTSNKFSVKRNNNDNYWKSSAFVIRKLNELSEEGGSGAVENGHEEPYRPYYRRLYKPPTNAEMLPLLLRLAGRSASRLAEKITSFDQWFLGYRFKTSPSDHNTTLYKFKYLIPPKDRFWADPFPVKEGGRYYIFFEEYLYETGKAHISAVEVDRRGMVGEPFKVLENKYHMSYPFIFEWRNDYYMIPETSGNRTVELYKCVGFPARWELEKVLLRDNNPVDATLAEIEGHWWMFVNIGAEGVSKNWDELHVFHADNPLGPWTPHRGNPVKSDVRCARPAGRLFRWAGDLYRPAQDCSKQYGYSVSLNRILRLSPTEFVEEEVSKVLPEWDKKVIATHTLNSLDEITVIDCLMKRAKLF